MAVQEPEQLGPVVLGGARGVAGVPAELAADYEERTGQALVFRLTVTDDPASQRLGASISSQLDEVGIGVDVTTLDDAAVVNQAISGGYDAVLWNGFGGFDPDTNAVWWQSGSTLNFGRIADPEIDAALAEARSVPDRQRRAERYRDVGAEFAREAYNVWTAYTTWSFAGAADVRGLDGPPLPGGDERGAPPSGVQPLLGLWRHR